ncbi:MAG TPA: peptidoglycan-associated lipoprotein Pal [Candidatus Hydrogenedentes bacterium]|nr:peptidoglycan-associated lipoprotein Pal [Candidatus Hydrogenedentota bacterium]HPJ98992.1 peptidoglycan-associated lipoprotein Pal [Candidatus Hydrogenedentota bacterium]
MSYKTSMKLFVLALVIVAVAVGGCGRKKTQITPDLTGDTTSRQSAGPESTSGEGLPSLEQEKLFFQQLAEAGTVYFAYDSSQLDPTAMGTLKRNAEIIKQMPNSVIQIEGHCDERGTQQYNLALGERRALAVRDYLIRLGISGDRLVTISYGEEDPVDPGHTESAWAKNRRAEFNRAN